MKRRRVNPVRWVGILAVCLSLLSCTIGGAAGIRPLGDLPEGFDGPYVGDIGSHSARITFTSGEPVVCNVAYGPDTSYGRLSLMAMTGPLTDHEVLMVGLQASTTYHLRITVTDLSSNVYQSDDMTFATVEEDKATRPTGVNVASMAYGGRVAGVSSNWSGGDVDSSFGGSKAIDGLPATEWSSDGDGDDAWIEIEFDRTYELNAVGFWTRTMGSSAQVFSFTVIADNEESLGPFEVPDASTVHYFPVQVEAKRIKIEVETSSGGNTGAVEIEAYSAEP